MRRFKVIIILTWLSVPIVAALLVFADYQRFNIVSTEQREQCSGRLRWLGSYNQQLSRLAQGISHIERPDDLNSWRTELDDLSRRMYRDSLRLGSAKLQLFPRTRQQLAEAELVLGSLKQVLEDTVDDRAYLFRVNDELIELARGIDELDATAQYYKLIGAEQIYMGLQETLAVREGNYSRQLRGRQRLVSGINEQLSETVQLTTELDTALEQLGQQIAEDTRLTYGRSLKQRFRNFRLRQELAELFAPGEPGANTNPQTANPRAGRQTPAYLQSPL